MASNLKIKDHKLYILLSNALENAFIHSKRPKVVKPEPILVPQPVVVVKEEKSCYTLQEIQQMLMKKRPIQ